jgi:hypothetical protein
MILTVSQLSNALTYSVCRARHSETSFLRHGENTNEHSKVPMAIVGHEYRIHLPNQQFDMSINLEEISNEAEDPYDCDITDDKFYLPPTAISCSAGPLKGQTFMGYLNLRSGLVHVDAIEHDWFWLTISAR